MTLNCIRWRSTSSGYQGCVEYSLVYSDSEWLCLLEYHSSVKYTCLKVIRIWKEYSMPCNCKSLVSRKVTWKWNCLVSVSGRETWVQSQVESYQRLKNCIEAFLLRTQHYKVGIKGKVEQSRERSCAPTTPWCSSYRKGRLRVILDYSRQLYFSFYLLESMYKQKTIIRYK